MGRFMARVARARRYAGYGGHDARVAVRDRDISTSRGSNRMRLGLYEQNSHGQTLIGHNGDTMAFHSILMLCPELNLGVFASYNNERGEKARDELIEAFLDRAVRRSGAATESPTRRAIPERYRGFYTSMRAPVSGHDKAAVAAANVRSERRRRRHAAGAHRRGSATLREDRQRPVRTGRRPRASGVRGRRRRWRRRCSSTRCRRSTWCASTNRYRRCAQGAFLVAVLVLCAAVWLLWPISWLTPSRPRRRHRRNASDAACRADVGVDHRLLLRDRAGGGGSARHRVRHAGSVQAGVVGADRVDTVAVAAAGLHLWCVGRDVCGGCRAGFTTRW